MVMLLLMFPLNDAICKPLVITIPACPSEDPLYLKEFVPDHPRLKIALSGGGSRGLAHIGVLEVLEEAGIRPDNITGVSTGALIGALYASGFTTDEITARLRKVDWSSAVFDKPERRTLLLARKGEQSRHLLTLRLGKNLAPVVPGALSPGQQLYENLLRLTLDAPYRPRNDWSELKYPLRILATDLQSGNGVIFRAGDITPCLRGSMSMPLLFDPFIYDTLQLIDGGITSNIPVSAARTSENDIVVAVDVTSPLKTPTPPIQPWQIVDQVTTILEREADTRSLDSADVSVIPELGDIAVVMPDQFDDIIEAGRQAMRKALPDLIQLLQRPEAPEDTVFYCFDRIAYRNDEPPPIEPPEEWLSESGARIGRIKTFLHRIYSLGTVRDASALYDSAASTLTIVCSKTGLLTDAEFTGAGLIPDSVLAAPFEPFFGKQLDFDSTRIALEGILRLHRENGFPVVTITRVNFDSSTGILSVCLDAGCLGGIRFVGLERVPKYLLTKEIPLRVGRPITRRGILKGMSNLYGTGLFRSVCPILVNEAGNDSCRWILEVHLNEHPAPPVRLGLAFHGEQMTKQGERLTRGFVELIYPSHLYYAARVVLFAAVDWRDAEYRLSSQADKIFGLPLTYNLSLAYRMRERNLYDRRHKSSELYNEARWGASIGVGGQAPTWGLITFTSRWERHENHYPQGKDELYNLSAIGVKLAIDTHDRTEFPNQGIKLESGLETAGRYMGSDRLFNRLWGNVAVFDTPIRRHTFGLQFVGATADRTTPFDERFRLGGMHSFPGLHLDELVGAMQLSCGAEYRFDLLSRFLADSYMGLRYDIGGSWSDSEAQISRDDWMHAGAIYFALDTLLGPLILQWGHLFDYGPLSSQDILYVRVGNQF